MESGLKRQSLLITGAGSGIGGATAFGNDGGDLVGQLGSQTLGQNK
jgi:hypothetical protein